MAETTTSDNGGLRSLRIPHNLRSRVANCNGSIEAVGVTVEPYCGNGPSNNAQLQALQAEQRMYEKLIHQSEKVEAFQKKVKERIKKRLKQENSLDNMMLCPAPSVAVERHEHTKNNKPLKSECDLQVSRGSERQRAVQKLLSVMDNDEEPVFDDLTDESVPHSSSEEQEWKDAGLKVMESWDSVPDGTKVDKKKSSSFLPPERLKISQKKEMAAQHLAVRRMYSAIERHQTRVNVENRKLQASVTKLKNKREQERRIMETEGSSIGEEEREEREKWLQTIALERRYQKLQKEKEMERYFEALHLQTKEKLPDMPSLCPCHSSLWTSDPNLCARNCQFYKNHSKFSIALKQLLKSVS